MSIGFLNFQTHRLQENYVILIFPFKITKKDGFLKGMKDTTSINSIQKHSTWVFGTLNYKLMQSAQHILAIDFKQKERRVHQNQTLNQRINT